jgi:hypothetical protein
MMPRLRLQLVATVRTAVRFLEPPFDALVPKDMFAFWQSQRRLVNALGSFYAELVVAYDASYMSMSALNF